MKIYVIIFSFVFSIRALSQEQNTQSAYWLGAGLGYGGLESNSSHFTDSANIGYKLEAGYKYNNYFSVYASYDYFNYPEPLNIFSTGLMGFENFSDDISIFGKAGVSYLPDTSHSNGLSGLIGAGIKLQLNSSTSAVIGYDFVNNISKNNLDFSDNDFIYFGFNYEFNNSKTYDYIEENDKKSISILDESPSSLDESSSYTEKPILKEEKNDIGIYFAKFGEIYFNFDSTLVVDTIPLIEYFSSLDFAAINHVSIYGHTDKIGSKEYNQILSENRALSVLNILVKIGIPKSNISYYGLGSNLPAEKHGTTSNALDRRVEISIEFNRID
ncbi:OmpA family protein [Vibrio sp. nBUS_14]|uniref:OmpA family protein n=1 Tax=Vibrio sp. nBUS_14 TaxID=3395321 RepID=UPI003EBE4C5F